MKLSAATKNKMFVVINQASIQSMFMPSVSLQMEWWLPEQLVLVKQFKTPQPLKKWYFQQDFASVMKKPVVLMVMPCIHLQNTVMCLTLHNLNNIVQHRTYTFFRCQRWRSISCTAHIRIHPSRMYQCKTDTIAILPISSFLNRLQSFLCPGYANFWCSLQQYDAV